MRWPVRTYRARRWLATRLMLGTTRLVDWLLPEPPPAASVPPPNRRPRRRHRA